MFGFLLVVVIAELIFVQINGKLIHFIAENSII